MSIQPLSAELKQRIDAFMKDHGGKVYQKIPHPELRDLPVFYDDVRLNIIEPHLAFQGGTALDVGTNWGRFAMWLEELGYSVTAIERSSEHAYIARGIRDACGNTFELIEGSIFDMEKPQYDVVLALNIFHHFLKTAENYDNLINFLERLKCNLLFLQVHRTDELQMQDAFKNMEPTELVAVVSECAGLPKSELIGQVSRREIYKLWRS